MVEWNDLKETVARAYDSKNCPNCGAPIVNEKCPYCGCVFVDFACMDVDKPFYIKINKNGIIHILKVKLNYAEMTQTESASYYDNCRYMTFSPVRELDMNFTIL